MKIKRQFIIPLGDSVGEMLQFLLKHDLSSIRFNAGKVSWQIWGTHLVAHFYPENPDEYGFSENVVFSVSLAMNSVKAYKPGLWVAEVQALYNAKKREEAELKLQEKMEQARNFIPLADLPTTTLKWHLLRDDSIWIVSAIIGLIMLYALFSGAALIAFSLVFITLVILMRNAYAELR